MSAKKGSKDTDRLRRFSRTAFVIMLTIGLFAVLGGIAVMSFSIDLGISYTVSGILCMVGAFGVLYVLNVLAGMADSMYAQYNLLQHERRKAESAKQPFDEDR